MKNKMFYYVTLYNLLFGVNHTIFQVKTSWCPIYWFQKMSAMSAMSARSLCLTYYVVVLLQVAKQHGSQNASKQVAYLWAKSLGKSKDQNMFL